MMDKKTLLENGILELYILGELNAKDTEQVEYLINSDKEIKTIFDNLEEDFERLGIDNSIAPPQEVKDQLLNSIKPEEDNSKAIPLNQKSNTKFYLGIAASFAGLLLLGSIWMYSQLNNTKQQLQTVENNNIELNEKLNQLNNKLDRDSELYATLTHPDTKQYILNGNTLLPDGKVVSYVNHNTKSVVINTKKLPKLDDEHDYQMWADVKGEMINMGVISKTENLLAMTYIDHAESLNITIEPSGGNDHPTVEKLVTNVYL